MNPLIEKAKLIKPRYNKKKWSQEEFELAVSWFNGELETFQCCQAVGCPINSWTARAATILRQACIREVIIIKLK